MNTKISEENLQQLAAMGFTSDMEEKLTHACSTKGIGTSLSIEIGDTFTINGIAIKEAVINEVAREWWVFTTQEGQDLSFRALFSEKGANTSDYWTAIDGNVLEGFNNWEKVYQPQRRRAADYISELEVLELNGKTVQCVAKGEKVSKTGAFTTTVYAFIVK